MSQINAADLRKRAPLAISVGIIAVLAIALVSGSSVYTDVLWFDQLGFLSVFTTQIWAQVAVFAVTAIFAAAVVWLNIYLAWRLRPIYVTGNDFFGRDLGEYRQVLDRLRKRVLFLVPVGIGIFVGTSQSSDWQAVVLFLNSTASGVLDPQFNLDVSFYLFDLPFYILLVSYLMVVTFLALIPVILFHLVYGGIKFNGKQSTLSKTARIQISVLSAIFMALLGATIWLGQYETMTSSAGLFTGATYSDVNASIPAAQILTAIAFVVALIYLAVAVVAKWSTVRIAQRMEEMGMLGNPFEHTEKDLKAWLMTCQHDEGQFAVHPKLMKVKNFGSDDEAKAAMEDGCSAIGHGSKGSYLGYKTPVIDCIDLGIKEACKELETRTQMGFEWIPGANWAQCH